MPIRYYTHKCPPNVEAYFDLVGVYMLQDKTWEQTCRGAIIQSEQRAGELAVVWNTDARRRFPTTPTCPADTTTAEEAILTNFRAWKARART